MERVGSGVGTYALFPRMHDWVDTAFFLFLVRTDVKQRENVLLADAEFGQFYVYILCMVLFTSCLSYSSLCSVGGEVTSLQ